MFYKYDSTTIKSMSVVKVSLMVLFLSSSTLNAIGGLDDDETEQQTILTRLNLMSSELQELKRENRSLREKVEKLTNPTLFSARLFNDVPDKWEPYSLQKNWQPMSFNRFEGDERLKDTQGLTYLIVPESGDYRIVAKYNFLSHPTGTSKPWVGINIDGLIESSFAETLAANVHLTGTLETRLRLAAGQKVSMSTCNEVNTQYHLRSFQIKVDRIN